MLEQILDDVGRNPDQLPIMQHALMRTWDEWQRNPQEPMIVGKHYEMIGRMEGALSKHADEAFQALNPTQKNICTCNKNKRIDTKKKLINTKKKVSGSQKGYASKISWVQKWSSSHCAFMPFFVFFVF